MKKAGNLFMYGLGALIVIGFFVFLYVLATTSMPPENNTTLNLVVGSLLTNFGLVVGFFYGSSKGSSDKTEMMNNNANTTPQV